MLLESLISRYQESADAITHLDLVHKFRLNFHSHFLRRDKSADSRMFTIVASMSSRGG